jgi:predicted transcriptional regulator
MTTLPPAIEHDLELDILEHIQTASGEVRQRDLATVIGKSLGMTNAILHRLTEKGLLMVSKVNNRNISYAVTPRGLRELAGRSYRYFKRTIRNVVDFKESIEHELCVQLQALAAVLPAEEPRQLLLAGASDLDFILEHLARKYHLVWRPVRLPEGLTLRDLGQYAGLGPGTIVVWSEEFEPAELPAVPCRAISLRVMAG